MVGLLINYFGAGYLDIFTSLSGVMWIGLLWYLNFVQIPSMPKFTDEQKPAITKVIAPAVLFWFRWAALSTIITGLIVAYLNGYIHEALALGIGSGGGTKYSDWYWNVVRFNHGLQCLGYYLAKSKKSSGNCGGTT